MVSCNYNQQSFFKTIFNAEKDFNYNHVHEMTEEMQKDHDPVGFYYFLKPVVYGLLHELRTINKRRTNLRDLLREMDRIWRINSQQRQILNEPDWRSNPGLVATRVVHLIHITRNKLGLEERAENVATGEVTKYHENVRPRMHPVATSEKQPGVTRLQVPRIDPEVTPSPFRPVTAFNTKVYIPGKSRRHNR